MATSAYSDPDLRQLRAPGRDASDLANVLRDPRIGGFDVQVLVNVSSGEVQEGIEDFCTDRHPDDQLMIYLSCHGVLDNYGRLYYAATNTRRQRLAATAIAAGWLNERLEDCRARRQILVLDCCHSGAFARGAKGDADLALQQRFEPHGRGRVVLTASRSTEYSFEGDQASGEGVPSVFTNAIVNGLRTGDADRDKDGLITVNDLYQYVYDNVRAAEPRQTPELWTYGAEGSLLVAHSIRGAVIEPEPLPEDLRTTLESPRPRVRETGVAELAELLDAGRPGLALTARQALERIADEDQAQVATLARMAVAAAAGTAADQVRRELADRVDQERRARQEALAQAARQPERQASPEAESGPLMAPSEDLQSRTDKERASKAPKSVMRVSAASVNQACSRSSHPQAAVRTAKPRAVSPGTTGLSMLRSKRTKPRHPIQYVLLGFVGFYLFMFSLRPATGSYGLVHNSNNIGLRVLFIGLATFGFALAFIMFVRGFFAGRERSYSPNWFPDFRNGKPEWRFRSPSERERRVRRWFWLLPPPWLEPPAEPPSGPPTW
jgi:hypothetical protein